LLKARNMAETIIGHIKEFSSLNLSKHRSVINAFVHIIAAITAYQINPIRPKRNLQPRYHLETTAWKPLIRSRIPSFITLICLANPSP
jgi:dolichol kinase